MVDESVKLLNQLKEIERGEISEVSKKYNIPVNVLEKVRGTSKGLMVNEHYPYNSKMRRKAYEKRKTELQIELAKLQLWVKKSGQRLVILFEGRDAAGKGGDDQKIYGASQPPLRENRCSGEAQRPGKDPVVLSKIY